MAGVVLGDVANVFSHPFTKSSLSVTNVLFEAYDAGYAVYDVISFAVTLSDGIVMASCDWTFDRPSMV